MSLVNISLIVQFPEDLLYLSLVVRVRRADKLVIRCVHQIPYSLDLSRDIVHKFLRRDPGFVRFQLDLLTMLVRTCLKEHVISLASLVAGNSVRKDDLIRVPDVRLA